MFEEESGTSHWRSKSCLRRIAIGAVAVSCLYAFYMAWVLHYPAVGGLVVDQSTGQAIAGAEVYKAAEGYVFPQERDRLVMGGVGNVVVPVKGTFSFRGGVGLRWGSMWPFQYVDRVALWVYAKDCIPVELSEANNVTAESLRGGVYGKSFKKDGDWEVFPSPYGTFRRKHLFLRGWIYKIEMVKAVSQEQWEAKCDRTLSLASESPSETTEHSAENAWLFNDLTGYLERWPEGEKSPNYFSELLGTGYIASCDYLQEQWAFGTMRKDSLASLFVRNQTILQLAQKVTMQREPIRAKVEQSSLQDMRDLTPCIERLLKQQEPKRRR